MPEKHPQELGFTDFHFSRELDTCFWSKDLGDHKQVLLFSRYELERQGCAHKQDTRYEVILMDNLQTYGKAANYSLFRCLQTLELSFEPSKSIRIWRD